MLNLSSQKTRSSPAALVIGLTLIAVAMVGCTPAGGQLPAVTPTISAVYQVDPPIREIYDFYGGVKVFGEPISQMVEQGGNKFQFTAAALWVVDPNASVDQFIRLAPLGTSIITPDRQDPPLPPPEQPDPYYDNGQYVYEPFRELYDRLEGQKFVGRSLTGVRYDALNDRYEQYFENLGFYIGAAVGSRPGLLSYGAWMCNTQCRSPQQLNGAIYESPEISPPFDVVVARLGREFTGEPLAMASQGADGRLEQVFASLVLVADASDPSNPDLVSIRPIVDQLGLLPAPLVEASQQADRYFYEVNSGLGYNIPVEFKNLIDQHGGFQISGEPINELANLNERIARQCFRNLCLVIDSSAPAHLRVRPAALGVDYLKANLRAPAAATVETQSFQQLSIQAWEAQEQVAAGQMQEIWASISQNGQPLANIQPLLIVNLPDGSQTRYEMPATSADGRTSLKIPPVSAANGILIPYELCVPQGEQMFCIRQEYLILNVP